MKPLKRKTKEMAAWLKARGGDMSASEAAAIDQKHLSMFGSDAMLDLSAEEHLLVGGGTLHCTGAIAAGWNICA